MEDAVFFIPRRCDSSLIDEKFGIPSTSHGAATIALNINVTYMKPTKKNTVLTANSIVMTPDGCKNAGELFDNHFMSNNSWCCVEDRVHL